MKYGRGGVVALRAFYGPTRVALAVAFSHTPSEERPDLGDDTINGGSLPIAGVEPLLQLA